eukprot:scaffold21783_cov124-Isochrysis_galbana.AAC.2
MGATRSAATDGRAAAPQQGPGRQRRRTLVIVWLVLRISLSSSSARSIMLRPSLSSFTVVLPLSASMIGSACAEAASPTLGAADRPGLGMGTRRQYTCAHLLVVQHAVLQVEHRELYMIVAQMLGEKWKHVEARILAIAIALEAELKVLDGVQRVHGRAEELAIAVVVL